MKRSLTVFLLLYNISTALTDKGIKKLMSTSFWNQGVGNLFLNPCCAMNPEVSMMVEKYNIIGRARLAFQGWIGSASNIGVVKKLTRHLLFMDMMFPHDDSDPNDYGELLNVLIKHTGEDPKDIIPRFIASCFEENNSSDKFVSIVQLLPQEILAISLNEDHHITVADAIYYFCLESSPSVLNIIQDLRCGINTDDVILYFCTGQKDVRLLLLDEEFILKFKEFVIASSLCKILKNDDAMICFFEKFYDIIILPDLMKRFTRHNNNNDNNACGDNVHIANLRSLIVKTLGEGNEDTDPVAIDCVIDIESDYSDGARDEQDMLTDGGIKMIMSMRFKDKHGSEFMVDPCSVISPDMWNFVHRFYITKHIKSVLQRKIENTRKKSLRNKFCEHLFHLRGMFPEDEDCGREFLEILEQSSGKSSFDIVLRFIASYLEKDPSKAYAQISPFMSGASKMLLSVTESSLPGRIITVGDAVQYLYTGDKGFPSSSILDEDSILVSKWVPLTIFLSKVINDRNAALFYEKLFDVVSNSSSSETCFLKCSCIQPDRSQSLLNLHSSMIKIFSDEKNNNRREDGGDERFWCFGSLCCFGSYDHKQEEMEVSYKASDEEHSNEVLE